MANRSDRHVSVSVRVQQLSDWIDFIKWHYNEIVRFTHPGIIYQIPYFNVSALQQVSKIFGSMGYVTIVEIDGEGVVGFDTLQKNAALLQNDWKKLQGVELWPTPAEKSRCWGKSKKV